MLEGFFLTIAKNIAVGVAVVVISKVVLQKFAPFLNQSLPILAAETESESFYV